jgi:PadR family transcriptional regulator, regulatory protein PadR
MDDQSASVFARIALWRLTPRAARHRLSGMEGEVLKGHLDMIVLAALAGGPAHGYAVIQEINRRSGGTFDLPEGTIYPVLHRLEKNGLLSSRWTIADSGRKRRTYTLTRRGRGALADQRAMWERFAGAISGLFGETYHAAARARH